MAKKSRRFEFVDGGSSKFWRIDSTGKAEYGKIGSSVDLNGGGPAKVYDAVEAQKVIASKLAKGYVEV